MALKSEVLFQYPQYEIYRKQIRSIKIVMALIFFSSRAQLASEKFCLFWPLLGPKKVANPCN